MNRLHLGKILAGLAATFTLAACSQDVLTDGTPLEEKVPLDLTASNLYEAVATPKTRGTIDGNWEGAKTVAVRVNGKIKKYAATSEPDGSIHLTGKDITDADTGFWWTANGQSKKVDAWYPYSAAVPVDWSVPLEQNAMTFIEKDLMCAPSTQVTQDNSRITFEHMLTKVVINLKCNSDYLKNASEVKVSLTGQYQTGTLRNYSGVWDFSGKAGESPNYTITAYESSPHATYQALVIPLGQSTQNIVIKVDGTAEYSCTISGCNFVDGYQYTFDITVKEQGLEVSPAISDWTTGGSENIEIGV